MIEWFAGINGIIVANLVLPWHICSVIKWVFMTVKWSNFMPVNHSNRNSVITILIHSAKALFEDIFLRLQKMQHCVDFKAYKCYILMPQTDFLKFPLHILDIQQILSDHITKCTVMYCRTKLFFSFQELCANFQFLSQWKCKLHMKWIRCMF